MKDRISAHFKPQCLSDTAASIRAPRSSALGCLRKGRKERIARAHRASQDTCASLCIARALLPNVGHAGSISCCLRCAVHDRLSCVVECAGGGVPRTGASGTSNVVCAVGSHCPVRINQSMIAPSDRCRRCSGSFSLDAPACLGPGCCLSEVMGRIPFSRHCGRYVCRYERTKTRLPCTCATTARHNR